MFKQPRRKILVGIISGALFSAASSVAVLAADESAKETHILISGSGGPVLSGRQGECVKTPVTPNDPSKQFEECGYAKEKEDPCAKDSDGDGVDDCKDKCPNTTKEDIAAGIDDQGCPVKRPIAVRNVLGADVLFDFDKSTLKEAGKQELNRIATEILQYSNRAFEVIVVGHADSIGTDQYNQKLSERRAKAVVDYLITQGVAANLFNPPNGRGEGEKSPIADNKTKEGRAKNRRVVIDIKSTDTPSQ